MAVRTKQLFRVQFLTSANDVTIYTAAAGETVILKELIVTSLETLAPLIAIAVRAGEINDPGPFWYIGQPTSPSAERNERWTVLQPGHTLVASVGVGVGTIDVRLIGSGTELEGVAD